MKYLDKLKKERSIDRVIFLAGMVLAFIGFLVPTVYVKMVVAEPVDNTIESEVEEGDAQGSEVGDDDFYEALINGTGASDDSDDENDVAVDDESVIILKETETNFVLDKNYDKVLNKNGEPKKVTTTAYSYVAPYEVEGHHIRNRVLNIFGLAAAFNVAPYAYNATFLVIMWICSIAGIALFFITKTIVGDIVTALIGLGFAIASAIMIPVTLKVFPVVGYMTIGGYMVLVGWIIAIAGSILGAAHIQHPSQVKSAE